LNLKDQVLSCQSLGIHIRQRAKSARQAQGQGRVPALRGLFPLKRMGTCLSNIFEIGCKLII